MRPPAFPPNLLPLVWIGVFSFLGPQPSPAATVTWTGAGGVNQSWVDAGNPNWSANDSPAGNNVVFDNTDVEPATTPVNNIVNSSLSISSLTYSNSSATINYQNTQIDSGVTLTVAGNFFAGSNTGGQRNGVTLSGLGGLVVNGTIFSVGGTQVSGSTAGNGSAVNMSGLANFTANLGTSGNFYVGRNQGSATYTSSLRLAATSEITTGSLHVGSEQQSSSNTQSLFLGDTANTIKADNIYIGSGNAGGSARGSGSLQFNSSTGTVSIDSATVAQGGANLYLVRSATGGATSATVNFLGHTANVKFNILSLAERTQSGQTTATFSFDLGTLTATSVRVANSGTFASSAGNTTATLSLGSVSSTVADTSTLGSLQMATNQQNLSTVTGTLNVAGGAHSVTGNAILSTTSGAGAAGTATSTINVTGGSLAIGGNVTMATASVATGTANATLNLTGGSMSIGGNLIKGGGVGTTTATVTLNGGSLDLTGGAIGSALSAINNLNFRSGTLANVAAINGSAGLTKTTAGTLTLAGTNSWLGNTVVSDGALLLAAGATLRFYLNDGGVSNQITGSGTGTLGLAGGLVFDFSSLSPVNGDSWVIVDVGSFAIVAYDPTFLVQGFTDIGGGIWESNDGYQFDESTGLLAYSAIPEPSAIGLLVVGLGFVLLRRRHGANSPRRL